MDKMIHFKKSESGYNFTNSEDLIDNPGYLPEQNGLNVLVEGFAVLSIGEIIPNDH